MRSSLILSGLLAAAASSCLVVSAPTSNTDGTITIDNRSSYVLAEVRVTEVASSSWGPNLLSSALSPGEALTVSTACATYDVLISDQHQRDCVLHSIDLCIADKVWVIDNSTLQYCGY